MHHCLEISEILLLILEFITPPNETYPWLGIRASIKTYAALAITCHMFSEPALDFMWRNRDLSHLVLSMPEDLWDMKPKNKSWTKFFNPPIPKFSRQLRPSDWESFSRHSQWMRYISTAGVSEEVLQALVDSAPAGVNIFPMVHSLGIPLLQLSSMSFIVRFLVNDILTELSMEFNRKTDIELVAKILGEIASKCPNITTIRFSITGYSLQRLSDIVSDFVCKYERLNSIIIPTLRLSKKAVQHIVTLPYLENLEWSPPNSFLSEAGSSSGFASIRTLHQNPGHLDTLENFLLTIRQFRSPTNVVELHFDISSRSGIQQVHGAFSLINERC